MFSVKNYNKHCQRAAYQTSAADKELPVESAELAVLVPPDGEQGLVAVEELAEAVEGAPFKPTIKYIYVQ